MALDLELIKIDSKPSNLELIQDCYGPQVAQDSMP